MLKIWGPLYVCSNEERYNEVAVYLVDTGWLLVWKTWKCQRILQLSGKCQELSEKTIVF